MPTPIDQLIPPDEADVRTYNELRDEFLSGKFPADPGEALVVATVTAEEFRAAMGIGVITKSAHRQLCVSTVGNTTCGRPTFTLVDGEPLCKEHR